MEILKDFSFKVDSDEGWKYVDYWAGVDRRDVVVQKIEKALSLAGTGSNLVPVYVDPQIVDLTRKATPLVELIPRVANRGKTCDFNQITALGDVGFKPEDAALADASDTYLRKSQAIRFLYTVGRVTGPLMAASAEYIDSFSQEVLMKTKQLRYYEEHGLLNGVQSSSNTLGAGTPFNSSAYDGLLAQQAGGTTTSATLYTSDSNLSTSSGSSLTIQNMRADITAARNNGGEPKLIITDWSSVDRIKGLLMDFQRYLDTTKLAWGIETLSFEGIPVLGSRFLANSGLPTSWTQNGSYWVPTGLTGPVMLYLDTDVVEMRVLQDVVMERLAKVNDADKFYMKLYEAVVNKAPQFSAIRINFS
jgi:hypothetical protein